jgi:hypothetical protein
MSRIRKVFVAVVSIVLVATDVGAVTSRGNHRHPPARPAAVVRSGALVVATPLAPPSADSDASTFVNLLTRFDPTIANQTDRRSSGRLRARRL